jgi:hypothetical protein
METTNTTGWWTCSDCGADAELMSCDTTGFRVDCPDCAGLMAEQWRWENAAA